jgi:polyhydroxyalkanoate synthesis regulator phasin
MPAPRSSRSASRSGATRNSRQGSTGKRSAQSGSGPSKGAASSKQAASSQGDASSRKSPSSSRRSASSRSRSARDRDGMATLFEQLVNRIIRPLGLVMLTRERIQETLDDAAERGRVTRSDANALAAELVRRGREQTDDMLADVEQLFGRGRSQLGSAKRRARRAEPVDQLVRAADRARRSVGVGPAFPISGYDDLTTSQVAARLDALSPADLRRLRDYESRHANRKSVLGAIEKALG